MFLIYLSRLFFWSGGETIGNSLECGTTINEFHKPIQPMNLNRKKRIKRESGKESYSLPAVMLKKHNNNK